MRTSIAETPEEALARSALESEQDAKASALLNAALQELTAFLSALDTTRCARMTSYRSVWTFWLHPTADGTILYWAAGTAGDEFEEVYRASDAVLEMSWSDEEHAAQCIRHWLQNTGPDLVDWEPSVLAAAVTAAEHQPISA